jgi:hypothetical protein
MATQATATAAAAAAEAATKAILEDVFSETSSNVGSPDVYEDEASLWTILASDPALGDEQLIIADIQAGLRAGADAHRTLADHISVEQAHRDREAKGQDGHHQDQHHSAGLHIAPFEGLDDPLSDMFLSGDNKGDESACLALGSHSCETLGRLDAPDSEMNDLVTELLSNKDAVRASSLGWDIDEGERLCGSALLSWQGW